MRTTLELLRYLEDARSSAVQYRICESRRRGGEPVWGAVSSQLFLDEAEVDFLIGLLESTLAQPRR